MRFGNLQIDCKIFGRGPIALNSLDQKEIERGIFFARDYFTAKIHSTCKFVTALQFLRKYAPLKIQLDRTLNLCNTVTVSYIVRLKYDGPKLYS